MGKIISNPIVNVEKNYELRKKKLQEFESSLPGGYHDTISCIIIKIDAAKKGIAAGKILDPKLVYARALALRLVNTNFDFEQLLCYELSPFPPYLFDRENVFVYSQTKVEPDENPES